MRSEVGDGGQGFYWKFENMTKAAEHKLGGCLAVVGEALAFHRRDFEPIPEWVKGDDTYLAVDFARRGLKVSVDTGVVATEPSVSPREQFERRIRIQSANLEQLARLWRAYGTPSPEMAMFHAHKTWRSTGGPACQLVLLGWAIRRYRSPLAMGWLALNALAAGDYVYCSLRNRNQGVLRSVATQAVGMPLVVCVGAVGRLTRRSRRGRTGGGTWQKIER